jgi:hypothetical protein
VTEPPQLVVMPPVEPEQLIQRAIEALDARRTSDRHRDIAVERLEEALLWLAAADAP